MLKREYIKYLCISLVFLLISLNLYLNNGLYPTVKNIINIVILALSLLFLLISVFTKNKGKYFFLFIAYIIVLGVYLPFLYPNNYATFNHLFTFWHLGVCMVLMVILGLFYSVKHIIAMACVNIVLMFIAILVVQNTDANYNEFNFI